MNKNNQPPQAQAGPGKYGHHSDRVLKEEDARACVVIVAAGTKGHGFSVSVRSDAMEEFLVNMPAVLRAVADQIEGAK